MGKLMTVIMPETGELDMMTFGTDDAIARVLIGLIDHENTDPGAVLYGYANIGDAVTAWEALREGGCAPLARRAFGWAGSWWLDAEEAASLFECLSDYAMRDTVCDIDNDAHRGYAGELCDCDRRNRAWSWASDIAKTAAGVELV